jgi:hypothetical protein
MKYFLFFFYFTLLSIVRIQTRFSIRLVCKIGKNWKKDVVAEFDLLPQQLPEVSFVIEGINKGGLASEYEAGKR